MSLKNLSVKIKIPKLLNNKLKNKRISKIYNKFEKSLNIDENFAVAVSGGPDSLALAFLAKIYSIKKKISAKFLIIDHKLRSESTKEANNVKSILKKYMIFSEILTWKGNKPKKNIQSKARTKRYELLFQKCNKLRIKNILLGHHQEDLIENFFIRMLRGSGLKGLISLNKETCIGDKKLFRPLLDFKKSDLVFVSKNVFAFYVKDPTNEDYKYQRIRVRKLLNKLKKDGLNQKKINQTLLNLRHSNEVVNFYVSENLSKNTFFSEKDKKLIVNEKFFQQPHEIIFRSLSESLKQIGGKYYAVRGKKLDRIISNYKKSHFFKLTLGGCIVEKVNQTVKISKEF